MKKWDSHIDIHTIANKNNANSVAFSPDGRLFVASFLLPHMSVFNPTTGAFLGRFGSSAAPAWTTCR